MKGWCFVFVLLMSHVVAVVAQQPGSTWSIAKPFVEDWDAEYRSAGRTIESRNKIAGQIRQFLKQHDKEIWAYEAAAVGLNRLNLNDDAAVVMREYLRRFPDDDTLAERVLFFFRIVGTVSDMNSLPERWRGNVDYWHSLLRVYVRTEAAPALVESAGREVLKRTPKEQDPGGNQRIRIAETWLKQGVSPRAAESVAREAVEIAEVGERPPATPSSTEQATILKRLLIVNVNRSTLGWALYQQKRFSEALAELKQAAAICERENIVSAGVYYRLGQTFERADRRKEALDSYFKAMAFENDEERADSAATDLYRRIHGSTNGLNALRRRRVNDLLTARVDDARDLVRSVDKELGRFEPLDDQRRPFDISQYRGKVVIVEFWATWCGICRVTMKQTNELQAALANHVAVVAWSDDPEETRAEAAQFLRDMKYQFKLVFGEASNRSLEVPFLPARLILDRNGRLRVMEFGYTPGSAAAFAQKLRAMVGDQ